MIAGGLQGLGFGVLPLEIRFMAWIKASRFKTQGLRLRLRVFGEWEL